MRAFSNPLMGLHRRGMIGLMTPGGLFDGAESSGDARLRSSNPMVITSSRIRRQGVQQQRMKFLLLTLPSFSRTYGDKPGLVIAAAVAAFRVSRFAKANAALSSSFHGTDPESGIGWL